MKEFIIIIPEQLDRMEQLSEAEFQVEIEEFTAWVEELSKIDNYIAAT